VLLKRIGELESRLADVQGELERSKRLATLGTLVAIVAHEFNNILTPVLSYAQLAQANPDDGALVMKALERSAAGAEKASRIATSILALSRRDGAPASDSQVADVNAAVCESLQSLPRDQTGNIRTEIDVAPGLRAAISALALQQVILNLVINARKAIGDKPGLVAIRARHKAIEGSTWNTTSANPESGGLSARLIIEIEDSGPGIRPDILARLFQPFVTSGDPKKSEGTGLGLTICQRLVEEAGGSIRADPRSPQGTRFTVTLPAVR